MTARAGFAKVEISTDAVGAMMAGYGNRAGGALSVHDPLFARALALERAGKRVAICGVDMCHVGEDVVAAVRARVASETGIGPEQVFVSATHTHGAPQDDAEGFGPDGLGAKIAEAVAQASERLQPVRVGAGWGMLHGLSLNRRRLEDPVDPAVLALRVDALDGSPLGIWFGFGCHPVVLGPDNRRVSGDWPARAAQVLEAHLGADAVAVFGQGAAGDVNPLTVDVRERFAAGDQRIVASAEAAAYYGAGDETGPGFDVGDRTGGTFAEVERIGDAVADEVMRVCRGIAPEPVTGLWTRRLMVSTGEAVADPPAGLPRPRGAGQPLEVMLVGVDGPGIVLVGVPLELFGATGVALRRELRRAGVRHPFLVTHANGRRGYLPPPSAFPEGGYEVDWAKSMGFHPTLEDDVTSAVINAVDRSI